MMSVYVAIVLLLGQEDGAKIDARLRETVSRFGQALRKGDSGEVKAFMLEESVPIVTEPRAVLNTGLGIHFPFATKGFDATIVTFHVLGRGRVLVRTNSSFMCFVETKDDGWKLYRYGDKPIE